MRLQQTKDGKTDVLMDFSSTGKGVAFGQVADRDRFICDMPAKFSKGAVIGTQSVIPTSRTATLNNLMYPLDIPNGLISRSSSDCALAKASLESQFGSKAVGYKPTGTEVEATWQPRSSSAGVITPHLIPSHIYYACVWARQQHGPTGSIDLYWPIAEPSFFSNKTLSATQTWQKISGRTKRDTFTEGDYPLRLDYNNNGSTEIMYFAAIVLYDLTATFGAGKEPDEEWCNANLDYEIQSIDVDDPTYEITPQLMCDGPIYMGGPNGQGVWSETGEPISDSGNIVAQRIYFNGSNSDEPVQLKNIYSPTDSSDATNKQYVDTAVDGKLSKSGGTITGQLTLNGKLILSSATYGNTLPSSGVAGQVFFKKI